MFLPAFPLCLWGIGGDCEFFRDIGYAGEDSKDFKFRILIFFPFILLRCD